MSLLPIVALFFLGDPSTSSLDDPTKVGELLFQDGKDLMAKGQVEAACEKFAESLRADAKSGTAENLAYCSEKTGHLAAAWNAYTAASALLDASGKHDRAEGVRGQRETLRPRLYWVRVQLDGRAGTTVRLDDTVREVTAEGWPLDPGVHSAAATAADQSVWSETFQVTKQAGSRTLVVKWRAPGSPEEHEPPSAAPAAAVGSMAPAHGLAGEEGAKPPWRTVGSVTAGVGVAVAAAGGYFALRAAGAWSDVKSGCPNYANGTCPTDALVGRANDASSYASVATPLLIGGGVLAAGGVALALVAGPNKPHEAISGASVHPQVGLGQAGLSGSF